MRPQELKVIIIYLYLLIETNLELFTNAKGEIQEQSLRSSTITKHIKA